MPEAASVRLRHRRWVSSVGWVAPLVGHSFLRFVVAIHCWDSRICTRRFVDRVILQRSVVDLLQMGQS